MAKIKIENKKEKKRKRITKILYASTSVPNQQGGYNSRRNPQEVFW